MERHLPPQIRLPNHLLTNPRRAEISLRKPLKLSKLKEHPANPLKKRRKSKMLNLMKVPTPAVAVAPEHLLVRKRRQKMPLRLSARRGLTPIARSNRLLLASHKKSSKKRCLTARRRALLRRVRPASKRSLSEHTYI